MKRLNPQSNTIIFGFDSAWANKSPGAICAVAYDDAGRVTFHEPCLVKFSEALEYINTKRRGYKLSLVAIDQPTVVPNATGSRPVDKVAASLVSFVGGGVQPANRGKASMFGEAAPVWEFLDDLKATQDPVKARFAKKGLFAMEVFPVTTLTALKPEFAKRRRIPKYNPVNRKKFKIQNWQAVLEVVEKTAKQFGIAGLSAWARKVDKDNRPRKSKQDELDATICLLAGLLWRAGSPGTSAMIGDTDTGYMITPITEETGERLKAAAREKNVPFLPAE